MTACPPVRLLYTVYPHMGEYTAVKPFVRRLRAAHVDLRVTPVQNGDDDFPIASARVRAFLRSRLGSMMPWYQLSDAAAELRMTLQWLGHRRTIIHYFDPEHSARYLPRLLKRMHVRRVRTMATFHQPPDLLERLIDPAVICSLDRIVVVSPTQRTFFEQYVPPERVRVILAGVDTEFFRPAESPRRPGPIRCITVGHWMRDWNALRALSTRLLERSADVEMHVVTDRETGLEEAPNVRRYRHLTDDQLRALYQSSDVLLLPLSGATANNALLEGLASGLPVVATLLPSVEAYISPAAALLVGDNNSELLLQALETIRSNDGLRTTMARFARARAEELSWETRAAAYSSLYAELAE